MTVNVSPSPPLPSSLSADARALPLPSFRPARIRSVYRPRPSMARRATSPFYLSDSRSLSLNRHSIRTPLSRSHLCCQLVRSDTAYSDSERSLSRSVLKLLVSITYLSFVGRSCLELGSAFSILASASSLPHQLAGKFSSS